MVFLAPPWGGPQYADDPLFHLSQMSPNGQEIFETALKITKNIAYFLPKNVDEEEVIHLASKVSKWNKCEVEENLLNKKMKGKTFYFGNLTSMT